MFQPQAMQLNGGRTQPRQPGEPQGNLPPPLKFTYLFILMNMYTSSASLPALKNESYQYCSNLGKTPTSPKISLSFYFDEYVYEFGKFATH